MENKFSLHEKLVSLVEDGLSIEDAASCLGLDPDHAKAVLNANNSIEKDKEREDPDNIIEQNKPRAIRKLIRIGLDDSIENISARVAALRAIVDYKSFVTEAENTKIQEMYKKMTEVSAKYEKELLSKKSEGTTTVVIPNTTTGTNVIASENFKEKFSKAKNKEETKLDYAV